MTWNFRCACGAHGSMTGQREAFDNLLSIIGGGHQGTGHRLMWWPRGMRSAAVEWVAA